MGMQNFSFFKNTSFNLAGEPLVETPQDVLKNFALGGFKALYIQGWLLQK
jgi:Predicted carbamoyl transferase, NodU family